LICLIVKYAANSYLEMVEWSLLGSAGGGCAFVSFQKKHFQLRFWGRGLGHPFRFS